MKRILIISTIVSVVSCSTAPSKADHERAILHLQIGTAYLTSGQYPMAMTELLKAEQLDPTNPMILNNLGLAFYVRGKLKPAEEKFRAAIRSDGMYSVGKNNLSRVLIDTGRTAEAIRILRIDNERSWVLYPFLHP